MKKENIYLSLSSLPMGVISSPNCSASDKLVIIALLSFAMGKDECYPRQEAIVKYSGMSIRSVAGSLKNLEHLGFIKRIKGNWEKDKRQMAYFINHQLVRFGHPDIQDIGNLNAETACNSCMNDQSYMQKLHILGAETACKSMQNLHASQAPIIVPNSTNSTKEKSNLSSFKKETRDDLSLKFFNQLESEFRAIHGENQNQNEKEALKSFLSEVGGWLAMMSLETHHPSSQAAKLNARPYSGHDMKMVIEALWGYRMEDVKKSLAMAYSGGYRLPLEPKSGKKQTFDVERASIAGTIIRCGSHPFSIERLDGKPIKTNMNQEIAGNRK